MGIGSVCGGAVKENLKTKRRGAERMKSEE
jgi:hypothetical protein